MTSKECLKILYNNLGCDDCRNDKCKFNREILRECDEWCEVIKQDLDRLEKLKKAIEIIVTKKVDIALLFIHKLEDYNFLVCVNERQLTKEEYELLKELI